MRSRPRPLTADEIAIGGRDRTLAGANRFAIGGKAHRAARLAPLEAGLGKEFVEPLSDRITLDSFRTRHDPGPHARRHLSAACDLGRRAQVTQPAVGAGAYKDPIHWR